MQFRGKVDGQGGERPSCFLDLIDASWEKGRFLHGPSPTLAGTLPPVSMGYFGLFP